MKTTNYKLEKGDTVRVTGCHGMLFTHDGDRRELADGVEFGVECTLEAGQDKDLEVKLPEGILADFSTYIHMACVELVKKGEPKLATVRHDPNYKIFVVQDGVEEQFLSKIWYEKIPKEVAEKCTKLIKKAYDTLALNRKEQE